MKSINYRLNENIKSGFFKNKNHLMYRAHTKSRYSNCQTHNTQKKMDSMTTSATNARLQG